MAANDTFSISLQSVVQLHVANVQELVMKRGGRGGGGGGGGGGHLAALSGQWVFLEDIVRGRAALLIASIIFVQDFRLIRRRTPSLRMSRSVQNEAPSSSSGLTACNSLAKAAVASHIE